MAITTTDISSGVRRGLSSLVLVALAGCVSTGDPVRIGYAELLSQAQASAAAGRTRAALETYERAAATDPARKEPWLRIAALQFDAGRHVPALAAAEQTLLRDPADTDAHAILVASSLEIAQQTMRQLRASGTPASADTRTRALQLSALMGQVFGAESLVPIEIKRRLALRAAAQCRASQSQLESLEQFPPPKPDPDPLDVLGDGE